MEKIIMDKYLINTGGEVYSLKNKNRKLLTPYKKDLTKNIYYVNINKRHKALAKLVYESFVRTLEEYEMIDYIDKDYTNCSLVNLKVIRKSDKLQVKYALTPIQKVEIRKKYYFDRKENSAIKLAEEYNVSVATIKNAIQEGKRCL